MNPLSLYTAGSTLKKGYDLLSNLISRPTSTGQMSNPLVQTTSTSTPSSTQAKPTELQQKPIGNENVANTELQTQQGPKALPSSSPAGLAERNNNPGNLRFIGQQGATQGDSGFARFNSPQEGFDAMVADLKAKQTGNTRTGLSGNSTLLDMLKVYAPSGDNNNPAQYANTVAKTLGINTNTPISQIDTVKLAHAMSQVEDNNYASNFNNGKYTGAVGEKGGYTGNTGNAGVPINQPMNQGNMQTNGMQTDQTQGMEQMGGMQDSGMGLEIDKYNEERMQIQSFIQTAYEQTNQAIQRMATGSVALNASDTQLIDDIQNTVDSTIRSIDQQTTNLENYYKEMAAVTGSNRTAPGQMIGNLQNLVTKRSIQIDNLNRNAKQQINNVIEQRREGNIAKAEKAYQEFKTISNERSKMLADMQEQVQKRSDDIRDYNFKVAEYKQKVLQNRQDVELKIEEMKQKSVMQEEELAIKQANLGLQREEFNLKKSIEEQKNAIETGGLITFSPTTDATTKRQFQDQVASTMAINKELQKYADLIETYGNMEVIPGKGKTLLEGQKGIITGLTKDAMQLGTLDTGVLMLVEQMVGSTGFGNILVNTEDTVSKVQNLKDMFDSKVQAKANVIGAKVSDNSFLAEYGSGGSTNPQDADINPFDN